ncbi:nucleoside hydrolase 3 [Ziziphus jujuba]|uniref:Nucleoside hydrolase 3 n=1 Tax=Ziziphus jujuba TaxID=326968 RepID=A0A6P3ZCG7_ZIZJJ|nr:nucleoside hydrolase 3 [Ziziphus jujuba]
MALLATMLLKILVWLQIMVLRLDVLNSGDYYAQAQPRRILVDTDMDGDDVFALLYLLKQNKTEFDLQAITINANGWSDAGHAVNHLYDLLFMMDRDHIPVGVGGEGAILPNHTILSDVGGYLPIIDQRSSTAGNCRYRQAIPVGHGGRLGVNTNHGLRRAFLPQGDRRYIPLQQPSTQKVTRDAISAGPITVFLLGSHTNLALFLIAHPHLKKNIEHIYAMGGAVRPTCNNPNSSKAGLCEEDFGNLYPQDTNPYAEFNIFEDPFAAYTVLHSGIPFTLIPLDATRTIPVDENFYLAFENKQDTYEAQYSFKTLKIVHDTWPNSDFYKQYCMWDSFMVGVALSQMRNSHGENEFAEMEYMNITVITSNEPYGTSDGSNPLIDWGSSNTIFKIEKNGVHGGHVQLGMQDQFCLVEGGHKGKCQDGYTKEVNGTEAVEILVATIAKPNQDSGSSLGKEFYKSFLDVLNQPEQTGRFNITTQFPYYEEILYKPDMRKLKGKPVVFDMDMSVGDFVALLYMLKLPAELINLKGILISGNGWATSATVDVVYDILHMMGRDDIPVGLGNVYAVGHAHPFYPAIGHCMYSKAVPQGSGGFLDSDTLYGLARDLPRSPRRYTEDTDNPELTKRTALDVWKSSVKSLNPGAKITILTSAPLTNLAEIVRSENTSVIQDIYIVGGHIRQDNEKGNLFTVPSNEYAEFNIFLDPLAAKTVFDSKLDVTLIPLHIQKQVSSFPKILNNLKLANRTPEALFVQRLLSRLWRLQQNNNRYLHVDTFLGEILGAVILAGNNPELNEEFNYKLLKVIAEGDISEIGQLIIDENQGKRVKVLKNVNEDAYYDHFTGVFGDHKQSAVIGSFWEQKIIWSNSLSSNNSH